MTCVPASCPECPCQGHYYDKGEEGMECHHPDGKGVCPRYDGIPPDCPLRDGDLHVELPHGV